MPPRGGDSPRRRPAPGADPDGTRSPGPDAARREPPAVTVMCSVRNGAATLPAVLDSIRAQTLDAWEFLVVDAASEDGTRELVRQAAREDPRIRLVEAGPVSQSAALNLALRQARASLAANLDADDPCHPERLAVQVARMEAEPHWGALATGSLFLWGNEEPAWEPPGGGATVALRRSLLRRNPVVHSSVVMRTQDALAVGGYPEDQDAGNDYSLWVRLEGAGHPVGLVPDVLSSHRMHAQQSFERRGRLRFVRACLGLQVRAIRSLGGGPTDYLMVAVRAGWHTLPRRLRHWCYTRLRPWQVRARTRAPR